MDIWHLDSLDPGHNDINPLNDMFDKNTDEDTSTTMNFDSYWLVEKDLEGVGQTFELYNESVQFFLPTKNWDGLYEIRVWLSDNGIKKFQILELIERIEN